MLHKTEKAYKPFELAETKYSTGRFHLMDVVVRRWSSLIQEALYERIGVMFDVSVQNVEQHRFEEFSTPFQNSRYTFLKRITRAEAFS